MLLSIFKRKKNNLKGFTLVETIVVVAVISILSIVILANHQSSQKQQAVQRAAHQLVGDIRRAQNMAMASAEQGGIIPDGYGIHVIKNSNHYFIFADKNNNQKRNGNGDEDIEPAISFPSNVEIFNIEPAPPAQVDIFFEPPDPTTYINGDSGALVDTVITLIFSGTLYEKTVTVKTSGQIEID
jgi:prepilin-type N-terminal cleavage/methylation domain-containing protein